MNSRNNRLYMRIGLKKVAALLVVILVFSFPLQFALAYAAPPPLQILWPGLDQSATCHDFNDYITNVTLSKSGVTAINNSSDASLTGGAWHTDYGRTDPQVSPGEVTIGETYQISVTVNGDDCSWHYLAVYVDWNQNSVNGTGGPIDSNEEVALWQGYTGLGSVTKTAFFTVPAGALTGYSYLRVMLDADSPGGSGDYTCGVGYGEIEDYVLNVSPATTYTATINPTHKTFTAATAGYGAQAAQEFTIQNTGTGAITGLSASLGGSSFEISTALSATSIASGSAVTVSVRPKTGLLANTYTDTLTITGNDGIYLTASLSFTVNAAPTYTAIIDPASKTYPAATAGYGAQAAQEFTIQNTGTGAITGLSASLGGSSFEISTALSATSIASGGAVTVSVRPVTGLSAGTYTDTLTITGDNGISLTASLSFTVNAGAAGTTLSAGDIVILEFNGNGIDGFSFMPLVDLDAGTTIHFTDYGWRDGAFIAEEESGSAMGNVITFTAPSNITAGTIFRQDKDNVGGSAFTGNPSWLINYLGQNFIHAFMATIAGHDGLIAFQGTPDLPNFLWAFQTGSWGGTDDYFNSDLPTGLINGVNAVFFADLPSGSDLTVDDGYYNGPTEEATVEVWRSRVANAANWITVADGTAPALLYPGSYTVISSTLTYTGSINPTSKTYPAATAGYGTQDAQEFTIQNTGTGAITGLSASLGGTSFEISTALSATSIAPGGAVTVSVRPVTGLSAGTYTDTLTVTGDNGISLTAGLSFTVNAAPTYTATIGPTGKTYPAATAGYGTQDAQVFTIQNTGTGAITGLSASLGGSSFEISTALSATGIASGSAVTVSVRPKTGLSANTYTDTLTVTGNDGIYLTASLSFTVNAAPTYTATIDPTGKTFPAATAGYGVQAAQEFIIQNTGTGAITGLSASLGGSNFEISTALSATSIASGGAVTVSVRPVTGLSAGTYTDTLTVTGDNGISLTAGLSFTVNAAPTFTATIDPTSKTYPAATAGYGTQDAQVFTIQNTGTGAITGLSASLGGSSFEISTALSATGIASGSAVTVSVRPKTGLSENTYTDTLTITGNDGIYLTASLSFTVNAAPTYTATIDPTGKTFPAATAGYSAQAAQVFTIQNTGTGAITGLSASLGGSSFEISTALSATGIASGSAVTVSVRPKTGLSENTYTDTLTITGNDGIYLTASLSFTVNAAPTYTAAIDPASKTYPAATAGYGAQAAQEFTIQNTGTGAITGLSASLGGSSFEISTALSATGIASGSAVTVSVRPKTGLLENTYTDTLTVTGNDGIYLTASLSFTVNAAPTYTATIDPTGKTYPAATAGYGAQAAQEFTIQNTGTGAITGLSASLGGSSFEISTALSATGIASGSAVTVSVRPKTGLLENTYTDTLTVTGNDGIYLTASLSFTVNAAPTYTATIDPTSKTYPAATAGYGTQDAQVFTIQNTGTGAITGLSASLGGSSFEISTALSATGIASGSAVTVSVRPKTGILENTYTDTLTVTGNDGIYLTASLSFTVNAAPTYTATIDPTGKTFPAATAGYGAQAAQEFTIQNTGTGAITGLSASLGGSSLEISTALSATGIASGSAVTVSVRPKTGLSENTYTDTLTVTGNDGIYLTASLSFTVNAAPTYTATIDPTGKTFPAATAGYGTQDAQVFTIQNTGTGAITGLSASLGGSSFEISTALSATGIASGSAVTVSVRPKTGLSANTYTDTLTVTGNDGIYLTASLSFTVNAALKYTATIDPASKTYPAATAGYGTQDAQEFTIQNTGTGAITGLSASLGGSSFEISTALSATGIASGSAVTVSVRPKTGLSANTYTDTLTVTGNDGIYLTASLSFTVNAAPTYTATIDPTGKTYPAATAGYGTPDAQVFTIQNTGTGAITGLSASLGGSSFEISTALSATGIASGSDVTVSVRPKTGLSANTYTDTLTITGNDGIYLTANLSFTVQSASYVITVNPLLKVFSSAAEGTAPPAGETFTVTNEGNMAVTLTQPTATNYIIGALSAISINPLETATFTVAPKADLAEGSYTETITIQGSGGASAQAEVRFTVTEALSYAIGAAPASITFDSLAQGYLLPDAQTVMVTNTGNQSISLYQPTSSHYTIGTLSITSLAPADTATFTVVPKAGLATGVWNETIQILGSYGVYAQVDVAFTCTEPLDYFIISGDGSTYQQNDPDSPNITVTANGDFNNFTGLTLNGELVDESNYDVTEGSTIVTLHQDFLDTLIPGTYTLIFHYTDGHAQAEIVVHEKMPETGDNDALVLFGSLIVLCLAALMLIRRRQALR